MSWGSKGVEYEADPRHAEIAIRELGLADARHVTTPGIKEEGRTKEVHKNPLKAAYAGAYRSLVARLNYLAADRPDISFAVKELARTMSAPTEGSWEQLKRMGRYLLLKPRMVTMFAWQDIPRELMTRIGQDAKNQENPFQVDAS